MFMIGHEPKIRTTATQIRTEGQSDEAQRQDESTTAPAKHYPRIQPTKQWPGPLPIRPAPTFSPTTTLPNREHLAPTHQTQIERFHAGPHEADDVRMFPQAFPQRRLLQELPEHGPGDQRRLEAFYHNLGPAPAGLVDGAEIALGQGTSLLGVQAELFEADQGESTLAEVCRVEGGDEGEVEWCVCVCVWRACSAKRHGE